ncbi:MAG: molybdopterin-dependent oxidoreductase [Nocardioidaceae bacterium]
MSARVGLWLGICFGIAFLTGLYSHFSQDTPSWLPLPTRPVWLYRVGQGIHVTTGVAAVPLLLVKLWAVYPKLFQRVPRRPWRHVVLHGLERGSIAVLVAAAIFELASGLANTAVWYPWAFHFRATHYAVGWLAVGALLVHIGVKLPVIRAALGADVDADLDSTSAPRARSTRGLTRRGLLRTTWVSAAVAVTSTVGMNEPLLRPISVLGVRSGHGPEGVPIKKTAHEVSVTAAALQPAYALQIVNGARQMSLTRDELERLPQTAARLPIACVEGWAASGEWEGVRIRDLLDRVGAPRGAEIRVSSLQRHGPFRATSMPAEFADDPLTLLALRLDGDDLSIDHGYPCRVIAPARPGVLQTKWVARIEVMT